MSIFDEDFCIVTDSLIERLLVQELLFDYDKDIQWKGAGRKKIKPLLDVIYVRNKILTVGLLKDPDIRTLTCEELKLHLKKNLKDLLGEL